MVKDKRLFFIMIAAVSLILITILFLTELYLRSRPDPNLVNERYGWKRTGPVIEYVTIEESFGVYNIIKTQYYKHGFKRWYNLSNTNQRVLIIGDSFTEMSKVENGKEWYSYLEKEFPEASKFKNFKISTIKISSIFPAF